LRRKEEASNEVKQESAFTSRNGGLRDPMKTAAELRQRAERYRRLERQINDPRALQAVCELVGEFQMTAQELEQRQLIRERAFQIWMEQGCPAGRQVEHWVTAERKITNRHRHPKRH
jgi:predicted patatin/cPLA2 family phospholipase